MINSSTPFRGTFYIIRSIYEQVGARGLEPLNLDIPLPGGTDGRMEKRDPEGLVL